MACVQRHFHAEITQVFLGTFFVFGDDFVTRTVVTKGLAKRDVHIDGKRQLLAHTSSLALRQCIHIILLAKGFDKTVRSRV